MYLFLLNNKTNLYLLAENEIEGYSVWESWSSWTCEILKSDLSSTCHMYRSRQCLSGNPADCHGLPFETTECHYSDCLGNNKGCLLKLKMHICMFNVGTVLFV